MCEDQTQSDNHPLKMSVCHIMVDLLQISPITAALLQHCFLVISISQLIGKLLLKSFKGFIQSQLDNHLFL